MFRVHFDLQLFLKHHMVIEHQWDGDWCLAIRKRAENAVSNYNWLWSVATRDLSIVQSGDECCMKTTPSNMIKMFGSNSVPLYFYLPAQIFGFVTFSQLRIAVVPSDSKLSAAVSWCSVVLWLMSYMSSVSGDVSRPTDTATHTLTCWSSSCQSGLPHVCAQNILKSAGRSCFRSSASCKIHYLYLILHFF